MRRLKVIEVIISQRFHSSFIWRHLALLVVTAYVVYYCTSQYSGDNKPNCWHFNKYVRQYLAFFHLSVSNRGWISLGRTAAAHCCCFSLFHYSLQYFKLIHCQNLAMSFDLFCGPLFPNWKAFFLLSVLFFVLLLRAIQQTTH